jgi:hypothetical protein
LGLSKALLVELGFHPDAVERAAKRALTGPAGRDLVAAFVAASGSAAADAAAAAHGGDGDANGAGAGKRRRRGSKRGNEERRPKSGKVRSAYQLFTTDALHTLKELKYQIPADPAAGRPAAREPRLGDVAVLWKRVPASAQDKMKRRFEEMRRIINDRVDATGAPVDVPKAVAEYLSANNLRAFDYRELLEKFGGAPEAAGAGGGAAASGEGGGGGTTTGTTATTGTTGTGTGTTGSGDDSDSSSDDSGDSEARRRAEAAARRAKEEEEEARRKKKERREKGGDKKGGDKKRGPSDGEGGSKHKHGKHHKKGGSGDLTD